MAPLAPPPGLESAGAAGAFGGPLGSLFGEAPSASAVPSTATGSVSRSVSSGGSSGGGSSGGGKGDETPADPALIEVVRQAALSDIEARVAERLQAVWRKGAQGLQQVQLDGEKSHAQLASTVAEFKVAQDAFEAENDKLKQTVASLVGRVAMLGGAMGPCPMSPFGGVDLWSAMTTSSSAPPTPSLSLDGHQSGLPTPASATAREDLWGASLAADGLPSLDLPPFPFPAPSPFGAFGAKEEAPLGSPSGSGSTRSAAPLSLAEALGIGSDPHEEPPPHSPVLLGFGAPTTPPAAPPRSPDLQGFGSPPEDAADAEVFIFGLSLRLADGAELGLVMRATDSASGGGTLHIESVVPGGASEAWNRQCSSSGAAEKVLVPGDRIVRVNDVGDDSQAMLNECESKRMLRLQVVRVAPPASGSPRPPASPAKEPAPLASPSKLRADATEWLPTTSPTTCASPPSSPSKFNVDASVFVPKGIASAGPISGVHVAAVTGAKPQVAGPVAPGAVVTDGSKATPRPAAAPAPEAAEGGKRSRRGAARAWARARGARDNV